jgi:VWFA-related protein
MTRTELGYYSEREQNRYFQAIVQLSTRLREGRTVVYSVSPANIGAGGTYASNTIRYMEFLKGVKSAREADSGNLALKVLVTQTGGQIMGPDNDLSGQIDRCIVDADAFYRISFDPARAQHADEYHDLKVAIDKPGLTARTDTGYYNQP